MRQWLISLCYRLITGALQSKEQIDSSWVTVSGLQASLTAKIVNAVSSVLREKLKDHPINVQRSADGKHVANVVLLRGCGMRLHLPSFYEKHGLKACIVAPTKILGGNDC
jgi:2,3-bisphosphoglycerate-independent phosphoglycerate mutase